MNCPMCGDPSTYRARSLPLEPDCQRAVWRCIGCGGEFATTETPDEPRLAVVPKYKRDVQEEVARHLAKILALRDAEL